MRTTSKVVNGAKNEALRLAAAGFHVGITTPNKKIPHLNLMAKMPQSKGGVWRATIDLATIESWWTTCPDGGVFVSPRNELIAIDIDDVRKFEDLLGPSFKERLEATFPTTSTPSGGLHFWVRLSGSESLNAKVRKLTFGEIIYEGFYALVPPSQATSKAGELGEYKAIAPLPDSVDEIPTIDEADFQRIILAGATNADSTGEGGRHDTLVSHAVELARQGVGKIDIKLRLEELNETFLPPFDINEAKKEIGDVVRWVEETIIAQKDTLDEMSAIRFVSMKELAERPAPRWLIPNLIPDSGLGFLIGKPAAGKSFFLQELAQSICRNIPLFGDSELQPTKSGWVLCLLPEAGPSWGVRTKTYCDYHKVGFHDDFVCCVQPLDLGDKDVWSQLWEAALEETKRRDSPPSLVIVDTLSAAIPGRDENSQADMTPLMARLQEFVSRGSAVVVAHHPAKYSDKYRGSSVIQGSCDWMISVIKAGGGLREFKSEKLRDAERITSRAFLIEPHAESAVCVQASRRGPWGLLDDYNEDHTGLRDTFIHHGLHVPGHDAKDACEGDISSDEGVSLQQLKETWRKYDPIRPTHKADPRGYKAADRTRTTVLLDIVSALRDADILVVVSGSISKSTRKLDAVVSQGFQDESA
jgi:hypothetical protein